ncbi:MAG: hypothetical protein ACLPM3_01985 [Terracidiphilus sp.]
MTIFTNHTAANAESYIQMAMALFCTYFVGLAALLTVGFLQNLMRTFFRGAHLASASIKKRIYKYTARGMANPKSFVRRFINPIQSWWIQRDVRTDSYAHNAYQVWAHAAESLLKARYGISPPSPTAMRADSQMAIWHEVLGTPTAEEIRGSSLLRTMYAAGWLGLIATQIAPTLWNRYYLGLSGALVVQGLYNDFFLSRLWNNRTYDIVMRTRCVLRDIPLVKAENQKAKVLDDELSD